MTNRRAKVVVDEQTSSFYTGFFDGERLSWEILAANYDRRPFSLRSFFRTNLQVQNNGCLLECCKGAGPTYYNVELRSFLVDKGEVFLSWEGFYQNCSDDFASRRGLKWTIGVSKITRSKECVFTDGLWPVKFEDCTTPNTILFQGDVARETMLGYSGLSVSQSPSGRRVFYLSVIENKSGVYGAAAIITNQIWTIPEGENYSQNPNTVQKFGQIHISNVFLNNVVDNIGTIRLRMNDKGYPTGACRTGYDAGVFCYSVDMDSEGVLIVSNEYQYVSREQVEERCTMSSSHYPITQILPPVATGLDVFWGQSSTGNAPEMLFFGCYGEINGLGNLTTVLADGTMHPTIKGAHAGSIVLGPDVSPPPAPLGDVIGPGWDTAMSGIEIPDHQHRKSLWISLGLLSLLAIALSWQRRRRSQKKGYELVNYQYELAICNEMGPAGSYIELA